MLTLVDAWFYVSVCIWKSVVFPIDTLIVLSGAKPHETVICVLWWNAHLRASVYTHGQTHPGLVWFVVEIISLVNNGSHNNSFPLFSLSTSLRSVPFFSFKNWSYTYIPFLLFHTLFNCLFLSMLSFYFSIHLSLCLPWFLQHKRVFSTSPQTSTRRWRPAGSRGAMLQVHAAAVATLWTTWDPKTWGLALLRCPQYTLHTTVAQSPHPAQLLPWPENCCLMVSHPLPMRPYPWRERTPLWPVVSLCNLHSNWTTWLAFKASRWDARIVLLEAFCRCIKCSNIYTLNVHLRIIQP